MRFAFLERLLSRQSWITNSQLEPWTQAKGLILIAQAMRADLVLKLGLHRRGWTSEISRRCLVVIDCKPSFFLSQLRQEMHFEEQV